MSGVQLADSQASSFERFTQMDADKIKITAGNVVVCVRSQGQFKKVTPTGCEQYDRRKDNDC